MKTPTSAPRPLAFRCGIRPCAAATPGTSRTIAAALNSRALMTINLPSSRSVASWMPGGEYNPDDSIVIRIGTWNVNGLRARQAQLQEWIDREHLDVICLQEIKATLDQIPVWLCDI